MTTALAQTNSDVSARPGDALPVVLVDGVPDAALRVIAYRAWGLLDERRCVLRLLDTSHAGRARFLLPRAAAVALPRKLADASVRWEVLAQGVLGLATLEMGHGERRCIVELTDDWTRRLEAPVDTPGPRGNSGRAASLTRGDAADWLAGLLDGALSVDLLSGAHRGVPLSADWVVAGTLREALRGLLGEAGWRVRCDRWRVDGVVHAAQAVLPKGWGRDFFLPWGDAGSAEPSVLRLASNRGLQSAVPGVLHGEVLLSGAWPTLRVGDHVLDLGGLGLNANGAATSIERDGSVVTELCVRFGLPPGKSETAIKFE